MCYKLKCIAYVKTLAAHYLLSLTLYGKSNFALAVTVFFPLVAARLYATVSDMMILRMLSKPASRLVSMEEDPTVLSSVRSPLYRG